MHLCWTPPDNCRCVDPETCFLLDIPIGKWLCYKERSQNCSSLSKCLLNISVCACSEHSQEQKRLGACVLGQVTGGEKTPKNRYENRCPVGG